VSGKMTKADIIVCREKMMYGSAANRLPQHCIAFHCVDSASGCIPAACLWIPYFLQEVFFCHYCARSRTPQSDGMRTAQLRRPNGGNRRSYKARDWNASFAPQISLLFSPKSWFLVTGVCRNKHNLPQLDRSSETLEVTAGKHLSTLAVAQTC